MKVLEEHLSTAKQTREVKRSKSMRMVNGAKSKVKPLVMR